MKILELTRSFYPSIGGMEKFVSDRLKIYDELGFDYQVITTTHYEKRIAEEKLSDVIYLSSFKPYEIIPNLSQAFRIDFDILSVNQVSYYYAVQAVNIAKKMQKKIIVTPHFHFHTDNYRLVKKIHDKYCVPRILKNSDKIICFTNIEKDYWINKFPFIIDKIELIPHYFNPHKKETSNKQNNYGKFLLFLGRPEKNKRIDLLIKAFSAIETEYQLVLTISENDLSSGLKNIVREDNRIRLLGTVTEENKQNLLESCSSLILPTDFEAFGIVNFEASFYKKPLLLTKLPVFQNILSNKGVIYFNNNLNSLKAAIISFLNLEEEQRKEMGEYNFRNLKNYSFEKITEKYSKILNELLVK